MTDNPYGSPPSNTPGPTSEAQLGSATRPAGVSILAALHFVGGLLLFGSQFLLFANLQAMDKSLSLIGIPPALLVTGLMFLSILTLASGVGMWLGTQWGWWLATFYYVYSVFRNASALMTVIAMADQLGDSARGPEYYMIKHGGRIIVHSLLFAYFFKGNVLAYFELDKLNKSKAISTLIGACITILVIISLIGKILA